MNRKEEDMNRIDTSITNRPSVRAFLRGLQAGGPA